MFSHRLNFIRKNITSWHRDRKLRDKNLGNKHKTNFAAGEIKEKLDFYFGGEEADFLHVKLGKETHMFTHITWMAAKLLLFIIFPLIVITNWLICKYWQILLWDICWYHKAKSTNTSMRSPPPRTPVPTTLFPLGMFCDGAMLHWGQTITNINHCSLIYMHTDV